MLPREKKWFAVILHLPFHTQNIALLYPKLMHCAVPQWVVSANCLMERKSDLSRDAQWVWESSWSVTQAVNPRVVLYLSELLRLSCEPWAWSISSAFSSSSTAASDPVLEAKLRELVTVDGSREHGDAVWADPHVVHVFAAMGLDCSLLCRVIWEGLSSWYPDFPHWVHPACRAGHHW